MSSGKPKTPKREAVLAVIPDVSGVLETGHQGAINVKRAVSGVPETKDITSPSPKGWLKPESILKVPELFQVYLKQEISSHSQRNIARNLDNQETIPDPRISTLTHDGEVDEQHEPGRNQ